MSGRAAAVLVLVFVLPLASGCLSLSKSAPDVDYYVLDYEAPDLPRLEPLQVVLRLERFSVAPPYNTERIVYRDGPFRLDAYNYHRWRANPGDLASFFLNRDFRDSGLFRMVLPLKTRFQGTYVLEGTVDELYERDTETGWQAVIGLSVSVMAEGEPDLSKRVLLQKSYRVMENCKANNPAAFTEAASSAMRRISGELILDVYHAVKQRRAG